MAQKLIREEAVYMLVDGHFAIDCACGFGDDVEFGKSSDDESPLVGNFSDYHKAMKLIRGRKHSFYLNEETLDS